MATHSRIFAWRIPKTEEPAAKSWTRLSDLAAAAAAHSGLHLVGLHGRPGQEGWGCVRLLLLNCLPQFP